MSHLAIAIPTRNRADLAMGAVESVLRSARPEVTVVVSDNSTDASERKLLEEFCAREAGRGVHYVRPAEPLPMGEHWEWLWQVVKRKFEPSHLAYLTDRLVFTAGAIPQLLDIIDQEPERVVSYHHDHVDDLSSPVQLVQTQWTGQLLELDARKLLELSSRVIYGDYLPRMLNNVAPMATLATLEKRFGNVFRPISPDYCFAYRCLATCDTILYLDRPCMIERAMSRSNGISFMRGRPNEAAIRFASELSAPRFGATPDPAFETNANAICQEYCSVREEVGGNRLPPVEWRSYLAANAISIDRLEDPGWRARMEDLLRSRGWKRRDSLRRVLSLWLEIAGYFVRHPSAFARSVKRQVWQRPPGTPLAFLLPRFGLNPRIRDDLKFESAANAIAYADANPRPPLPTAWHVHRLSRAGAIVRTSSVSAD
jgi:hypothetical protein